MPAKDARIGLDNRGFKFGDGVFETIRIHNLKPYNFDFHLNRLNIGLSFLQIHFDAHNLKDDIIALLKKNKLTDGFARIFIHRDSESQGYYPTTNLGSAVIETFTLKMDESKPAKLYISNYSSPCLVKAKLMSSAGYVIAMMEARANACDNALILEDENVCETASGNIFWFKDNVLYTPSDELKLIPGSIRERILSLYMGDIAVGKYTLDQLASADEIFMSNVNRLVLPFAALQPLGRQFKIEKSLEIKELLENDLDAMA